MSYWKVEGSSPSGSISPENDSKLFNSHFCSSAGLEHPAYILSIYTCWLDTNTR